MATDQLKTKDRYENLTPKQRAVVDAYVEHPDYGRNKLAQKATELLKRREGEGESVSSSYVPVVLQSQEQIIQNRMQEDTNDVFSKLDSTDKPQTIGERPVKSTEEPNAHLLDALTREEATQIIQEHSVPQSLLDRLLTEVTEEAFLEN